MVSFEFAPILKKILPDEGLQINRVQPVLEAYLEPKSIGSIGKFYCWLISNVIFSLLQM